MPEKPIQLEVADFSRLREKCQEFIDHVERYGIEEFDIDDDLIGIERAIASTALDAIFGDGVWKWMRDIAEGRRSA